MTPEQIVEMTDKITRSLNAGETLDATKIAPMNVPIIEVERLIKDIQRNQVTQTAVAVMSRIMCRTMDHLPRKKRYKSFDDG